MNADPGALDAAERTVRGRASQHPDAVGAIDRIDATEVRALFPPAAPELSGLFVSGGARVDGRTMRDALLMGAGHRGATVLRGRVELERDSGRAVARVDGERLEADAVVVAAGAWTVELLRTSASRSDSNRSAGRSHTCALRTVERSGLLEVPQR